MNTLYQTMKSLNLTIFLLLCLFVNAQNESFKPEFAEGEIIIGYKLTHQLKSRSSMKIMIDNEYNTLANTLSNELGINIVSKSPVCNWLVDEMVKHNKPEKAFIKQPGFLKSLSTNEPIKQYQQLVLKIEKDELVDSLIRLINGKTYNNYKIRYACRNHYYYSNTIPDDSLFSKQWSHKITQADSAWAFQNDSSDVVIGIIDSGVDYLHDDLKGNIVPGYDFVDLKIDSAKIKDNPKTYAPGEDYLYPDNDPMDFGGHGTHCAGIAVAKRNDIGVVGVAPNCKVMPLRAGFLFKERGKLSADFIVSATMYAANNGVNIISMSFGSGAYNEAFVEAIEYAHSYGIIMVASAGNSNTQSIQYPCGYDHVISVGSTTKNDVKSDFSNFGSGIDIMAPGSNIISTLPMSSSHRTDSLGYGVLSGTSMACPYVAGAFALLKSNKPLLTKEEIVKTVLSTADNIDTLNPDFMCKLGMGRINVLNALTSSPEPNIVVKSMTQTDSSGNDLYLFRPGQTVQIRASFQNTWQSADTVKFKLKSNNQYISVIQNSFTVDSLMSDQMVSNKEMPFKYQIDNAVPDNYTINLQIEYRYNDEIKNIPISIITSIENKFNVPADFATIQEAIDSVSNGDVIIVEPGEYFENINFKGKRITLASKYYLTKNPTFIASTIINGSTTVDSVSNDNDSGSTVFLANKENRASKLIGFTITGGSGTKRDNFYGGGIYCERSSPHLEALIITDNKLLMGAGVGIYMRDCLNPPLLKNLTFSNSKDQSLIAAYNTTFEVDDLTIKNHLHGDVMRLTDSNIAMKNVSIIDCSPDQHAISISGGDSVVFEKLVMRGVDDGIRLSDCNYVGLYHVEVNNSKTRGLDCSNVNKLNIDDSKFISNEEKGVHLYMTDTVFINNSVMQKSEFGLYIFKCGKVRVQNSVISNCFGRSGIFVSQSTADIINVTVAGNFSKFSNIGAGIHIVESDANLINSIIYGNKWFNIKANETKLSSIAYLNNSDTSRFRVAYTNIEGGSEIFNDNANSPKGLEWLEGNMNIDPLFFKPYQADYHLADHSPMIGKGIDFFEYESSVWIDLDTTDYIGDMPDMGAYVSYDSYVKADFEVNKRYGSLPLQVEFDNRSYSYKTETPDSFIWVLSQKDTIFNADLDYTFNDEGWHTIELIAHNGSMFDNESKHKHIYTFSIDTFFVDTEGSDTLGIGSPDAPFRSIQHAVNLARKNDVVIVNPGIYYEQVKLEGEEFVLASRYILNNDTSFISQTIIDGSNERENILTIANRATEKTRIVGLTFQNAYQTSESSLKHGAGIFCYKSSPTISNCIIRNNTAYFRGGGLYLYESESLVDNCLVAHNKTSKSLSQGGGIAVFSGEPRFDSIRVVNNSSCKYGGGMFFYSSNVKIKRSEIMYNVVSDSTITGYGGGIYYIDGSLYIDNSRIESNTAPNGGGGLFLEKVKATIANSHFGKNKAGQADSTGQGGAIYIQDSKSDELSQIKRTVFESNIAQNEGGAIYCGNNAGIELHGLTLLNNISLNNNSGAVCVDKNADTKILSSILWGNQPEQIGIADDIDSTQVLMYSSIEGGFKGKNNTDLYPMFVDTTHSNLNLKIKSPCIDAGSPLSDTDPDGSVADMGAFYYDQTYPEFVDTLYDLTICDNNILSITANVRGAGRLYFEWYKDGWLFLEGNPLFLNKTYPSHSGEYYCIVKNNKRDAATSNRFKIEVLPSSKVVIDTTINEGESFFAENKLQHNTGTYTDTYTNVQGCDSTVITNLTVEDFVDISEFKNDFNVYPNPTKRYLFIESDSFKEARIFNLKGDWIETFHTTRIDLAEMSKGIYLLMITKQDDSQHWMKIILSK